MDRNKYFIDDKECIDYYIQFESLHEGVKEVCARLSVPFEPSRIPQFKKGFRHSSVSIQDYYDEETVANVRKLYAWEIERFGYDLHQVG